MKWINGLGLALSLAALTACGSSESSSSSEPSSTTASEVVATPSQGLHGTDMRHENIGGDFEMTDGDGKPWKLSDLQGKVVVLSFGYTHCPDVCPTELMTYNDAVKQLGDAGKDVAVVFASVDPERDTPELIGKYVRQFNPDFIGLTVTGEQNLPLIKQQYQIVSAKTGEQSEKVYLVDHTAGAYLIDKSGNIAIFEPYGNTATQIAQDLKTLL